MQRKVAIASILKPVDDVRSYWKIGRSIQKIGNYQLFLLGNTSEEAKRDSYGVTGHQEKDKEHIRFFRHDVTPNQFTKRIALRWKLLIRLWKIRPHAIIIGTHELLLAATFLKYMCRCRVIYDVQENYNANARYLSQGIFKRLYASIIHLKEKLFHFAVDEYWLAERCYLHELTFVKGKARVLENKAYKLPFAMKPETNKPDSLSLLYSGTVSYYGGVHLALRLFHVLHKKAPETTLRIIGQVHDQTLGKKLRDEHTKNSNIQLNISRKPIPHEDILNAVANANLGIIGYQPELVNQDKVPTKLYEYSRYGLPYVVQKNTLWLNKGHQLGGAISIDFSMIDIQKICEQLDKKANLFPASYPQEATWEFESQQLENSFKNLNI